MRFKIFIFVDFLAKVEAFIGGSLPTTLPTTATTTSERVRYIIYNRILK